MFKESARIERRMAAVRISHRTHANQGKSVIILAEELIRTSFSYPISDIYEVISALSRGDKFPNHHLDRSRIRMGNAGRASSIVLACVPSVQTTRSSRRPVAANAMCRHLGHTCNSVSQSSFLVVKLGDIELEYFKEDLIWKHVYCGRASVAEVNRRRRMLH